MAIPATQMRPGMIIKHNNELHTVFSVEHRTPGNLRAFIQAKLRNIRTGAMYVERFRSPDPIDRVIVDEVFLGGAVSQQRWQKALSGLQVLWVGVRCESSVAAGRELARGDRVVGMAELQADVVHQGVFYDLEVDTTHIEALECARIIAAHGHGTDA